MTKHQLLKQYFGYDSFRPLQAEIIDALMQNQSCLVLMPTGGGKSVCYQIPALMRDGLTVVISPLIALMKDQVEGLKANGIAAAYLNSSLTSHEQDAILWQAKLGELKLLYIAPEKLLAGNMLNFFQQLSVNLFAIDESHCISSWGHDFRPEYRQLTILKEKFPNIPIVALTATADKVTRKDILKQLAIEEGQTYISSFDRPNLSLSVLPGRKRIQQIQDFILTQKNNSGIIYCLSRKATESVSESLRKAGFKAECYHAGLDAATRSRVQEAFIKDDIQVIVATVAFGMGIDKSNIRWVIHYNLLSNVESFYQEIGRAGRDGDDAKTILFYSYQDVMTRQDMILNSELPDEQKELMQAKLDRMKQYAEADICRRRILLSYFNEDVEQDCGNCDVCKNPRSKFNATVLAQKALSAIARTKEKVAMGALIDILRGSRNQNTLKHQYDKLPTFGVGRDVRGEEWADYISQFLNSGIMDIAYDEAHVLKLNAASWQVLKGERQVEIAEFVSINERKAREEELVPKEKPKQQIIKDALFERLRQLRKSLADSLNIAPYLIFTDATLSEMAQKRPISEAQMKAVSGIGSEKFRRFGDVFMKEIIAFAKENTSTGTRVAKGFTYVQTYELYKDGLGIDEIAEQRQLNPTTIVSHLVRLKSEGYAISLSQFIEPKAYNEIIDAARFIQIKRGDAMLPLFEHLQQKYSYDKIRLALAVWEFEENFG